MGLFTQWGSKARAPRVYLVQLLLFILVDEICNNYFLALFSEVAPISKGLELLFYASFLLLRMICSPLQAGFSDFYCRRKSLVFSLCVSIFSSALCALYFRKGIAFIWLLALVGFLKGTFGNNLPLAWAGIADTQTKNTRFALALSTSAIALGYLALIILYHHFRDSQIAVIVFFLFLALLFLCLEYFYDIRDEREKEEKKQTSSLRKEMEQIRSQFLGSRRFRLGMITFFLWEFSFYSAHLLAIDLRISSFDGLTISMICGYLVGVLCTSQLTEKTDQKMIEIGFRISSSSFLFIFIPALFVSDMHGVINFSYFIYSIGAAFLVPSLFSTLSTERKIHAQGKIYGLLDAVDVFAICCATLIAIVISWHEYEWPVFISISCASFFASWIPYGRFKKTAVIV